MAMPGGCNHPDLIARLRTDPHRFRFFQAARLLALAEKAAGREGLPRRLRFRTQASMAFPASEISRFETRGDDSDTADQELEVTFFGLTGPSGVLPQHYTEFLVERKNQFRDEAGHAFFDLFNHRALSLFVQAWGKYRFPLAYERGQRDGFTRYLIDLLACGRPAEMAPEAQASSGGGIPTQLLAFFAGILGRRPLAGSSLEAMVSAYFGVKVNLEQFVGQWIGAERQEEDPSQARGMVLGRDIVLGDRVWDCQTKVRLRLGPMDMARFTAFQPDGKAAMALRQLVDLCLGQTLSCDVVLVLDQREQPQLALGREAKPALGLNTWLHTRPARRDLDDAGYKLI